MVPKIVLFISFICVACTSGGANVSEPPQPFPNTPVSPTTPTNTTTTTPTINTTTSIPTTKATTPTTSATTTSTTPLPTTVKPTPAPVPRPDIGKWNVTDNSVNKTFILAEMAVQLNITYDTVSNETKYIILDIPKNASANGTFWNDNQTLFITWLNQDNTSNQFIILFEKNSTINHYMITNMNVSVTLTKKMFPELKDNVTITLHHNKTEFSTTLMKSYRCAKEQVFDLQDGSNKTVGAIKLSHVQLEAFHDKMDVLFDAAEDCERGSSPDVVPIVVGCALVGLVAIVLIAYLVGRRRSQNRGYLSM